MALDLHPKAQLKLVDFLKKNLPTLIVEEGVYLNEASALNLSKIDEIVPGGKKKEQLDDFFNDSPVFEFIRHEIGKMLRRSDQLSSQNPQKPLSATVAFSDIQKSAEYLVTALNSLPYTYTCTFELSRILIEPCSILGTPIKLSDDVRLLTGTDLIEQNFPFPDDISNADKLKNATAYLFLGLLGAQAGLDESTIYLQVEVKGYIKEFGTSKTLVDAETKFREFFGIGLTIGLFDSYNIDSLASILGSLIDRSIFVHRQSKGQWILEAKLQQDPDITRFLSRIKLAHSYESFKEDGDYFDCFRDKINTIKYCLSANAQSERVLRACRWVFDSFLGKNELLSFVQTMVALEILLGEKAESDLMGLGALLRNRCAYLIGKTQSEREKLLKEFNEIYKVRCDIVHQGKSRLSFNENIQFQRLRDICNRVINAEINLLISDLNHTQ